MAFYLNIDISRPPGLSFDLQTIAMHDALAISDILSSIFKFTDTETDVGCVRVCKAWYEPALDALWYRVDKLEQLLKLLGPMGEVSPGLQVRS